MPRPKKYVKLARLNLVKANQANPNHHSGMRSGRKRTVTVLQDVTNSDVDRRRSTESTKEMKKKKKKENKIMKMQSMRREKKALNVSFTTLFKIFQYLGFFFYKNIFSFRNNPRIKYKDFANENTCYQSIQPNFVQLIEPNKQNIGRTWAKRFFQQTFTTTGTRCSG